MEPALLQRHVRHLARAVADVPVRTAITARIRAHAEAVEAALARELSALLGRPAAAIASEPTAYAIATRPATPFRAVAVMCVANEEVHIESALRDLIGEGLDLISSITTATIGPSRSRTSSWAADCCRSNGCTGRASSQSPNSSTPNGASPNGSTTTGSYTSTPTNGSARPNRDRRCSTGCAPPMPRAQRRALQRVRVRAAAGRGSVCDGLPAAQHALLLPSAALSVLAAGVEAPQRSGQPPVRRAPGLGARTARLRSTSRCATTSRSASGTSGASTSAVRSPTPRSHTGSITTAWT